MPNNERVRLLNQTDGTNLTNKNLYIQYKPIEENKFLQLQVKIWTS